MPPVAGQPAHRAAPRPLHGLLLGLALAALFLGAGCQSVPVPSAQKTAVRQTIRAFQQALNTRSPEAVKSLLTSSATIGGASPELSRAGLEQGSLWSPFRILDTQILALKQTSDGPEARVAMYAAKAVLTLRLGFDTAGKIRSITADPLWKTPEPSMPNELTSSFVVSNGLLFVQAKVNGKAGYMLFDTGSSDLLLNPKYFGAQARQGLGVSATVNGLKKSGGLARVASLEWQGFRAGNLDGEMHDFSNMEKPANTPLLGAISFAQVKNCAVLLDGPRQTIKVFALRADGSKKTRSAEPLPTARVPFTYFLHLPLFPMRIDGQEFSMLFDSGAQWNLLPNTTGVESHFRPMGRLSGFSDGGAPSNNPVPAGLVDQASIGAATFHNLPFAVFQIPYFPGKGFLGTPLIQHSRLEINFRTREISLWQ